MEPAVVGERSVSEEDGEKIQLAPSPPPPPSPLMTPAEGFCTTPRDTFAPVRLHFAINNDNRSELIKLIESGIELNYIIHGNSPLILTILREQLANAHSLIEAGANTNLPEKTKWQRQPLHLAARLGNIDLLNALIEHGACIHSVDNTLLTALHWASIYGNLAAVVYLVNNGCHVNVRDDTGRTPLFRAAEANRPEIVRFLFESGTSANIVDNFGWTALFQSVVCGQMDMVREILSYNPNVHIRDNHGQTLLHVAVGRLDTENLKILCRSDINIYTRHLKLATDSVFRALQAEPTDYEIALLLLDFGVDINAVDTNGKSALLIAAEDGNFLLMQLLASAGVDVSRESWVTDRKWPEAITRDVEICEWLVLKAQLRVRLLSELCKYVIRESLCPGISEKLHELPLPGKLKEFLHIEFTL